VNATVVLLLSLTAVCAVLDWAAVYIERKPLEYVFKPATMVALIGVALALDPSDDTARVCFVVALAFSLAGDVFLMLPQDRFVFGLASFLLGHVAYIVGFVAVGVEPVGLFVGAVLVGISVVLLARRIVEAVKRTSPEMVTPVEGYIAVISAMVIAACGTLNPFAVGGALLFYASDALIAWNRFIEEYPWGRLAIIITYHLGQIGIVLSLAW
jgi:uncharacterized membrane protein YhhN